MYGCPANVASEIANRREKRVIVFSSAYWNVFRSFSAISFSPDALRRHAGPADASVRAKRYYVGKPPYRYRRAFLPVMVTENDHRITTVLLDKTRKWGNYSLLRVASGVRPS